MTRLNFAAHPFLLGFEDLDRLVERTAKSGDSYPPYNIEQRGETAYRITLAVAGFSENDLAITLEDRQLVVRGRAAREGEAERVYLHRGIATRQFQRVFVLADGMEVTGAHLDCGMLHVDLARSAPESVVKTIAIKKPA
ncbi:Hsp20 family protein [Rubrimonas cliftonensis]|uniref:Molecular chaperone IbpA, HSP20 family n=1 Tax=Rubrimonas cliftonensis TaxID=89524 RepID=A0A1H4A803_9RHOB|nr:Hsp20 family protein [Rubrimonas cliftonensis]SEA32119.1 Molecular chaperone IbpA, HSP20 family [Rubrimonas cliftonensis]